MNGKPSLAGIFVSPLVLPGCMLFETRRQKVSPRQELVSDVRSRGAVNANIQKRAVATHQNGDAELAVGIDW